jgi:hypothetical protein
MRKKEITIDDLAIMVQKGFNETAKKIDVDKGFDAVDKRFDKVENRLDRIEKLILTNHNERIETLEMEVKKLKDLLALN